MKKKVSENRLFNRERSVDLNLLQNENIHRHIRNSYLIKVMRYVVK